ncbi:MAG: hypothetical protein MHMPM18_000826 [Marteilia pararefringens]
MGFGPFGKSERQRAAEEQMLNTSSKQHAENADEAIARLVKKSDETRAQMIAIRDSAKRSGAAGLPIYQKKQLQYLHGELMRIDKQLEHNYSIKSKYSDMSLAVQQSKDVAYIGKNIKEATKDMKINQKKVNLEKITAYQTEFDMNKMQVENVTDMVFQQEEFIDDEILFEELGLGDLNDLSTVQASAPQLQDTNIASQAEQLIIGSDLDLGTDKIQSDVEPKKKVDSLGVPL